MRDITGDDRKALEHALGEELRDDQRLIVQVLSLTEASETAPSAGHPESGYDELPAWCNVFAGLSDAEIANIEQAATQRLSLTHEAQDLDTDSVR